jgi:hypothetical protein
MINNEYKIYVKTNENGSIINAKTEPFISGYGWVEAGVHNDRHYHITYKNDGIYNYKLVNGEIVEMTEAEQVSDKLAILKTQKIQLAREATIKKLAENDNGFKSKKTEIEAAKTIEDIENIEDIQ